jgi:hypothetical protein
MFMLIALAIGILLGATLVKQPEAGVALVDKIIDKAPVLAPLFNRKKV